MRQSKYFFYQIIPNIWQRSPGKYKKIIKVTLTFLLLILTIRIIPYFIPIRAVDITQEQQAIEFSDRHNLPLGIILTSDQNHTAVVPLNQVSPYFIQAIIAAEDKRFYQHGALDIIAISRAILEAIQAKKIMSGASTITMQLARMLDNNPSMILGKSQEIWTAWRLTAGMSKDEIIAAYINRLPMGGNIYGVEAASRNYFGIPASELNLAQATILAAIPNNPNRFNPYYLWEPLKKRQKYVLDRLVEDGYITSAQANLAAKEEILLQSNHPGIIAAPHFLFWLANQLPKPHRSQIKTTLDRPLQQFLQTQIEELINSLKPNNVHHAAALVIDNHTGEILAYIGSPNYFDITQLGRNDGVQALRQPGSTLKPFLYELALEKGIIQPNSILADIPTHYAIPGAKIYSPKDYHETFQGLVRVRIALANSLNIPAVKLLEKVGVDNFLSRLHELGFTHLNQTPEYYGLGLSLGSGEVSLWELARAYLVIARQGELIPLTTFFDTTNNQQNLTTSTKIDSPATWALITDILSDSHARATAFGVDSVLKLPFPAAVKTGTSSDFRDTWTVGFTNDYTVATWVGNFNGDRLQEVSGVTGAAPLWNRIMLHLHENQEPAAFSPPVGMEKRPICAETGLSPTPDCTSIVQEYLYTENNQQLDLENPPKPAPSLKIIFPENDDYFILNPGESQPLEFKLNLIPKQPIEWWLNGKKLATNNSNSIFWDLQPGNWNLQVKMGEITDKISFQVQLSENKPTKRGFSISNENP
mgnify:CR=1 FL=1